MPHAWQIPKINSFYCKIQCKMKLSLKCLCFLPFYFLFCNIFEWRNEFAGWIFMFTVVYKKKQWYNKWHDRLPLWPSEARNHIPREGLTETRRPNPIYSQHFSHGIWVWILIWFCLVGRICHCYIVVEGYFAGNCQFEYFTCRIYWNARMKLGFDEQE